MAITVAFCCGFFAGSRKKPAPVSFHDMIVEHPHSLSGLVTPKNWRVRELADELKTPENAYAYVRDRIAFDPSLPALPAGSIITEKKASCMGKAALLCSLYRAMGVPADKVRIVTGEVVGPPGSIIDHAWVYLDYNGKCLQQDTTSLLGTFTFDQFQGTAYTNAFIQEEGYAFNDKGFALISRLNMMKGAGGHPRVN
jgi:hypothetical protein